MRILEKKDLEEEVRAALSRERAANRRIERELKGVQSGDKVSSFLQKQSESNDVLRASIAIATSRDPMELAQATIQYQKAIETKSPQETRRVGVEQIQPEPQTVLPPRPNDSSIYSLITEATELKWLPYGGGGDPLPFKLIPTTDENGNAKILVSYGEVNSAGCDGMSEGDNPPYFIEPQNGDFVYVSLTFGEYREIQSRKIEYGQSIPENTNEGIYIKIGKVGVQDGVYFIKQQSRIGNIFLREYLVSINGVLCRDYVQTYVDSPVQINTA
jgi:hypothetical protein